MYTNYSRRGPWFLQRAAPAASPDAGPIQMCGIARIVSLFIRLNLERAAAVLTHNFSCSVRALHGASRLGLCLSGCVAIELAIFCARARVRLVREFCSAEKCLRTINKNGRNFFGLFSAGLHSVRPVAVEIFSWRFLE